MMSVGGFTVVRDAEGLIGRVVRNLSQFCAPVVVCVDSRTTDDTARIAQSAGAEVFEHRFHTDSYEDALNACVARLDTDWVMSLHDDELIGPRFIEQLPRLLESRIAWRFPHYNLWPDEAHYIESAPYWPDYQLRLIPRTIWESRGGWPEHVHASPAWPCQFSDVGIFHSKFLVKSVEARQARMDAWAAMWAPSAGDHYRAFSIVEGRDVHAAPIPEPLPEEALV